MYTYSGVFNDNYYYYYYYCLSCTAPVGLLPRRVEDGHAHLLADWEIKCEIKWDTDIDSTVQSLSLVLAARKHTMEKTVEKAKVAEQAERYEDMAKVCECQRYMSSNNLMCVIVTACLLCM